jgi:CHAD domain-containing protein
VKRLKALYQILETLSDGVFEYKAHFEAIRRLFKAVGTLRDLQVQSQLFASFAAEEEEAEIIGFYQYLQKCHDKESKKVDKALYQFNPEVMNDSLHDISFLLDQKPEKKRTNLVLKYLNKRFKQIEKLNRIRNDEEKIHLMRTRLKQVMYSIELMKKIGSGRILLSPIGEIKKAGSTLGLWHDHIILGDKLQRYIKKTAIIKAPYQKLLKAIRQKEAFYLKKARKQVEKLLQSR